MQYIDIVFILILSIFFSTLGCLMFVLGYNTSAPSGRKISIRKQKVEKTEDELLLEKINNASL